MAAHRYGVSQKTGKREGLMVRPRSNTPRRPATKLPHLRKKMDRSRLREKAVKKK
jgi:hypothetical protein